MTKKQGYSSIVCFVTISIITIILLLNGLIIHAEGVEEVEEESNNSFSGLYGYDFTEYGLWTPTGYENSYFYNSAAYLPNGYQSPVSESFVDNLDLSSYYQQYPYFVFTQDYSNRNLYYIYLFTDPSLFVIYGNHTIGIRGSGDWIQIVCTNGANGIITAGTVTNYSGSMVMSGTYTHRFVFSNIDVYSVTSNISGDGVLTANDYVNINYNIYDTEGNLIYENPITSGGGDESAYPDGSGGEIINNMYMETADWKFDIPQYWSDTSKDTYFYARQSNWGKGTVSFYGQINDFVIDHAEDYEIQVDFYVKFNGKHNVPGVFDGDNPVMRSFAHSFAWRNVSVPLTDFINSNNLYSWSVDEIFNNALDSDYYNIKHYDDYYGVFAYYRNWDWKLYCSAHLVSGNYTSGNIQEQYDFITMISKETSNTITDNHNPWYPEDENGDPVIDEGDDSQTIVTDGNGNNIILQNNDNDHITINGNGEVAERIVNDLLPEESGAGLSQQFQNILNSNGWVAVVQNTFSFVPESVINTISLYLVTVLGILAAAFVLRIVLDLL